MDKDFKIMLASGAVPPLRFAAEELCKFIEKSMGFIPEIRESSGGAEQKAIYIGCGKEVPGELNSSEDGFAVICEGENIFLVSPSFRGVIYAVYDFSERFLGVRFLTRDYTYIPELRGFITEPRTYISVPDFPVRTFLTKNISDCDLFAVRNRMLGDCFKIRDEYGGNIKWRYSNHAMLRYVPKEIYFTSENRAVNAHLYQLNEKGEPIDVCMTDGIDENGEEDESMPVSAFKIVLESLKKIIADDENCNYISIGQMDHTDACSCPKCVSRAKKYGRGGINVIFGNLLLKKLRAWMAKNGLKRNIKLVFFAYNYSVYAPVCRKNGRIIPAVKADKDLIVRIAPIGANCYYPIDSDMHFYPYKRIIDEWRAVCDKIMLWTYHTNYKCYLWFFPTMQHWAEDLRYFKESGTEFLFMQSDHTEAVDWKADMETYVASKMLWDCSSDPYALRREYIDLMFGAAAEYVVKIIDIFEKNYARIAENSQKVRHEFNLALFGKDPEFPFETSSEKVAEVLRKEADAEWTKNVYFSIYHLEITWAKVQPKELLKEQMRLLTEAKGAVCGDIGAERIITALEKIELSLRFMTAYNYKEYYGEEGRDEYIAEFFALCDKLGYEKIGEGRNMAALKDKFII